MMKQSYISFILVLLFLVAGKAFSQESVFNGLKSNSKRGDRYYNINEYQNALDLYLLAESKKNSVARTKLKIGRTYYQLKDYENSALWYDKYLAESNSLPDKDLYNYAEALRSSGDYEKAILFYKRYQEINPEDKTIIEKIWRLSNIQFLLEDSIYYSINMVDINSAGPAYSPAFYKDGLVFVADKMNIGGIAKLDGFNNTQFKTLYFAEIQVDTMNAQRRYKFSEAKEFGKEVAAKYNTGPVTFFPDEDKMIITKNGNFDQQQGSRLQLFIAEKANDKWHETSSLPFNSMNYSVSNPALNSDGNMLFFVSDMPGGFGQKDLYVSHYKNNSWSKPVNLGDKVNTPGDEESPFVLNTALYFSSNGHNGLGGLDIYKIDYRFLSEEVTNMGYPINSSYDDFGLALNDEGTRGFISSNRLNGGFDDNIYEIEIDLQSYPLTIHGKVKYKELNWRGTKRDELLSKANLLLIDNRRKIQVGTTKTDSLGNFQLDIPYASSYVLKIVSPIVGEITVKLEIPKNKKPDSVHDIVIIKNKTGEFDAEAENNF
jgi:tetratricopeptide (TPR) repeat protein